MAEMTATDKLLQHPISKDLKGTELAAWSRTQAHLEWEGSFFKEPLSLVLEKLTKALKDSNDSECTQAAIWAIGKIAVSNDLPGEVVEAVNNSLRSDCIFVREEAVIALGWIASPTSVPVLIGALEDKSPRVRHAAALSLGKVSEACGAIRALRKVIDDEREWEHIREAATKACCILFSVLISDFLAKKISFSDLRKVVI